MSKKLNPFGVMFETLVVIVRYWREMLFAFLPAAMVLFLVISAVYLSLASTPDFFGLAKYFIDPTSLQAEVGRQRTLGAMAMLLVGWAASFAIFGVPAAQKIVLGQSGSFTSFLRLRTLRLFISLLITLFVLLAVYVCIVGLGWIAITTWVTQVLKDPVAIEGTLPLVVLSAVVAKIVALFLFGASSFILVRAAVGPTSVFPIRESRVRGNYLRLVIGILFLVGVWFLVGFGVLSLATDIAGSAPPTNEIIRVFPQIEKSPYFPDYSYDHRPTPAWIFVLRGLLQLFEYMLLWVLVCVAYRRVVTTSTSDH